ncbi:MAG: hypothetical protein J6P20_07520, partial [Oscillospiraceae bacterium]|nr:hypothetical protein [Oscillospiraceae bacterium]
MWNKRICSLLIAAVCTGTAVWSFLSAAQTADRCSVRNTAVLAEAADQQPVLCIGDVTAEPGETVS